MSLEKEEMASQLANYSEAYDELQRECLELKLTLRDTERLHAKWRNDFFKMKANYNAVKADLDEVITERDAERRKAVKLIAKFEKEVEDLNREIAQMHCDNYKKSEAKG